MWNTNSGWRNTPAPVQPTQRAGAPVAPAPQTPPPSPYAPQSTAPIYSGNDPRSFSQPSSVRAAYYNTPGGNSNNPLYIDDPNIFANGPPANYTNAEGQAYTYQNSFGDVHGYRDSQGNMVYGTPNKSLSPSATGIPSAPPGPSTMFLSDAQRAGIQNWNQQAGDSGYLDAVFQNWGEAYPEQAAKWPEDRQNLWALTYHPDPDVRREALRQQRLQYDPQGTGQWNIPQGMAAPGGVSGEHGYLPGQGYVNFPELLDATGIPSNLPYFLQPMEPTDWSNAGTQYPAYTPGQGGAGQLPPDLLGLPVQPDGGGYPIDANGKPLDDPRDWPPGFTPPPGTSAYDAWMAYQQWLAQQGGGGNTGGGNTGGGNTGGGGNYSYDPNSQSIQASVGEVATYNPHTQEVEYNDLAKNQLADAMNTPFAQLARKQAMDEMNSKGLLNSSLSQNAATRAAIEAGMPAALQDAGTYAETRMRNVDSINKALSENTTNRNAMTKANMDALNAFGLDTQQYQHQLGTMDAEFEQKKWLAQFDEATRTKLTQMELNNKTLLANMDVDQKNHAIAVQQVAANSEWVMGAVSNIQKQEDLTAAQRGVLMDEVMAIHNANLELIVSLAGLPPVNWGGMGGYTDLLPDGTADGDTGEEDEDKFPWDNFDYT